MDKSTSVPTQIQVVQAFYAAINLRQLHLLNVLLDPEFEPHMEMTGCGVDAFKLALQMYINAFSGFCNRVDHLLVDNDFVTASVRTFGIHTGVFLGHLPSNRPFCASAIEIFRVSHMHIVERWGVFDTITMLIQLGLYAPVPVPAAAHPAMLAMKAHPTSEPLMTVSKA